MIKRIVELAGTESPSESFTAGVMQRIEAAQNANAQPIGAIATFQRPIIRPVVWLWTAFVGVAIVAVSFVFAQKPTADGIVSLSDLLRFSNVFAYVINKEVAQIVAIVVIITSILFSIDIVLSHRKT